MKHGFTLIELLVVMAIMGVLAAIIVPLSTDAIRTSRESTCRNNLKNLQVAAVNYANDHSGQLPRAGSFEVQDHTGIWHERRGWISWVRGNNGQYPSGKKQPQVGNMQDGWVVGEEGFNAERALFAITNGTLFAYAGEDLGLYVCPEAVKAAPFKAFGKSKGFSTYVMNEFFHWEGCKDHRWNDPRHLTSIGTSRDTICSGMDNSDRGFNGFAPEAANLLLFAEHCGGSTSGDVSGWKDKDYRIGRNCVLHVPFKNPDSKDAAYIGTYHGKKSSPLGMAIFLDGHIVAEHPTGETGEVKNRAYWFCRGESPENED